jgi:hypothetical protein
MSVLNRTLDVSEQRKVFEVQTGAMATGVTTVVGIVPYPSVLDAAQIVAYGTSGAPTYQLNVDRFIVGTGFTTIILATGSSNTPPAFGTSGLGASGMIKAADGSTLLNLLANDVLVLTSGGSNAAAKALAVGVVLKPIQDVKVHFGLK